MLSGGLDSTVNLVRAKEEHDACLALTFDYGQEAAKAEETAAREICTHYDVEHHLIDTRWLKRYWSRMWPDSVSPAGVPSSEEAREAWVPNRNGLLVNAAAAVAEGMGIGTVVIGLNKEEAERFPDNSREFLEAINRSLATSTISGVKAISYTVDMEKIEIGEMAKRLEIPWGLLWSCYGGGERMCGECISCCLLVKAASACDALVELEGRI